MKKCPYCAEEIQDEAILCRYCHSDLSATFPQGMSTTTAQGSAAATPSATGPSPSTGATAGATPGATPPTAGATSTPSATPTSGATPTTADATSTPSAAPTAGTPSADDEMWGVRSAPTPTASPSPAEPAAGAAPTYTHTGQQYVLGYGEDFFGIWDRRSPDVPTERFPRTDDGWRQAWTRYASIEPANAPIDETAAAPAASADTGPAPIQSAGISAPTGTAAMQYTHSGQRYLLGYGSDFFGIWDRNQLSEPIRRYPRTDDGWRQAWSEFVAWEPNSVEVGIGG